MGVADDEMHDYFTGLTNDAGATLWGLREAGAELQRLDLLDEHRW